MRVRLLLFQKELAVAFGRDARIAKDGPLKALLRRYRDVFNLVAECLNEKEMRLGAGRTASANKAENGVSHLLRGSGFR